MPSFWAIYFDQNKITVSVRGKCQFIGTTNRQLNNLVIHQSRSISYEMQSSLTTQTVEPHASPFYL